MIVRGTEEVQEATAPQAVTALTVLLISPNFSTRVRLTRILARRARVVEARDLVSVDRILASFLPSVIVLDLRAERARAEADLATVCRLSAAPVLVLAGQGLDAASALKLGAQGFCALNCDPTVALKAVETIARGEPWFERTVMLRVVEEFRAQSPPRPARIEGLTARERAICQLVAQGACNKDIARALSISEKTVKNDLTNIFDKLGLSSRLELALRIHQT